MLSLTPRSIARGLLSAVNVRLSVSDRQRIPQGIPVIVISNHRSFLDAAILIHTLPQPLRIACHHYMGKTPFLREIVNSLGCFPLAEIQQRQQQFFIQANQLLMTRQWVGLFPEGTQPMIEPTKPQELAEFQRGFAHLAWRSSTPNLAVLPIAIASLDETIYPTFPIRWLKYCDRDEPFFDRSGLHPILVYHRVRVLIGHPYFISPQQKLEYKGKQAKQLANYLTDYCREQIQQLLQEGSKN
jgi:1-acyl-sn-glycerol-3-phosphate acyltransferase